VLSFLPFNRKIKRVPFNCDIHSHLLPGLDDGVKSLEESKEVILKLLDLGYTRAITTPHIMNDSYRNTPEGIEQKLAEVRDYLKSQNILFPLEAAAEYYLDETLMSIIEKKASLLTFGNNYLLFETNYLTEPYTLRDFIFKVTLLGYKPVMAHPERYHYMTLEKAEDLCNRGVLLQLNILSLSGYYSRPVQRMAEKIIEKKWVHFLGSDCHNPVHANQLQAALQAKGFRKALDLPLLNYSL
jgi:protein-tyrosine phosphatase